MSDTNDPFDLQRFVSAQQTVYATALAEIQRGQKRSHWMWFIFPQIDGLGFSSMARRYAIKSQAEAQSYLEHPLLGARLAACASALLAITGRSAGAIFGSPDDMKLHSSMTLFAQVAPPDSVFAKVIEQYFGGKQDEATLRLLAQQVAGS